MPAAISPCWSPPGRCAGSVAASRRRPALVRGQPEAETAATLVAHFTAQPATAEGSYFWFGGEESLVVPLRRHVRRTLDVDRQRVYVVPGAAARMKMPITQDRHAVMDS